MFVCEHQLLGSVHELTEQRIGTQIFNRPHNYNPGEDNIVRSYARLLRKRLEEYFEEEGANEPLRITIPRGGYVPVFNKQSVEDQPASLISGESVKSEAADGDNNKAPDVAGHRVVLPKTHQRSTWVPLLAGLLAGILLTSLMFLRFLTEERKSSGPGRVIWAQLFQRNRDTLIVPADSGLGILQNLTGHLVSLPEYASGTYLTDVKPLPTIDEGNLNDLRRERYTSVVDLNITSMLTQLPEFAGNRSHIRYARSITTEDLKHSNAILLGSVHSNPWVSLFDGDLNFKLEYTPAIDQSFVKNEHPVGTEQPRYLNGAADAANQNHTYGVIDYVSSLDGVGYVLIIQGLNMAATQAAADVLFNAKEMGPVLKQAELPDGSLRSFELLIETTSIGATAPNSQIISTRFYPPRK
jgi:hypothetical protein